MVNPHPTQYKNLTLDDFGILGKQEYVSNTVVRLIKHIPKLILSYLENCFKLTVIANPGEWRNLATVHKWWHWKKVFFFPSGGCFFNGIMWEPQTGLLGVIPTGMIARITYSLPLLHWGVFLTRKSWLEVTVNRNLSYKVIWKAVERVSSMEGNFSLGKSCTLLLYTNKQEQKKHLTQCLPVVSYFRNMNIWWYSLSEKRH